MPGYTCAHGLGLRARTPFLSLSDCLRRLHMRHVFVLLWYRGRRVWGWGLVALACSFLMVALFSGSPGLRGPLASFGAAPLFRGFPRVPGPSCCHGLTSSLCIILHMFVGIRAHVGAHVYLTA